MIFEVPESAPSMFDDKFSAPAVRLVRGGALAAHVNIGERIVSGLILARRPPVEQIAPQFIENIKRFQSGLPLFQLTDQTLGY